MSALVLGMVLSVSAEVTGDALRRHPPVAWTRPATGMPHQVQVMGFGTDAGACRVTALNGAPKAVSEIEPAPRPEKSMFPLGRIWTRFAPAFDCRVSSAPWPAATPARMVRLVLPGVAAIRNLSFVV